MCELSPQPSRTLRADTRRGTDTFNDGETSVYGQAVADPRAKNSLEQGPGDRGRETA